MSSFAKNIQHVTYFKTANQQQHQNPVNEPSFTNLHLLVCFLQTNIGGSLFMKHGVCVIYIVLCVPYINHVHSDFRYVAPFWNQGNSETTGVFALFSPAKFTRRVGEMSKQIFCTRPNTDI